MHIAIRPDLDQRNGEAAELNQSTVADEPGDSQAGNWAADHAARLARIWETPMKCPTCNGTMRPGRSSIHRSNLGLLDDAVLFDRIGAQAQYLYFQPAGADEATYVDHTGNVHGCPK